MFIQDFPAAGAPDNSYLADAADPSVEKKFYKKTDSCFHGELYFSKSKKARK